MRTKTKHYPHWYLLSLRGLFLIVLGIYTITLPIDPVVKFSRLFELFAVISGLLLIQSALLNKQHANWQFVLFNGFLDLSFGIMLWLVPELSFSTLKIIIAIWLMYSGLIQVIDSLILIHDSVKNWWFELIAGMSSFILAFILIVVHVKIQTEVYLLMGIFTIIFGVFLFVTPFFLKETIED
jgi:uncharacterized membrane protein HdeD (DUF308 family)